MKRALNFGRVCEIPIFTVFALKFNKLKILEDEKYIINAFKIGGNKHADKIVLEI